MNRSAFRFPAAVPQAHADQRLDLKAGPDSVFAQDHQNEVYHRYLFALQFCLERHVLDVSDNDGFGSYCLGQVAQSVLAILPDPDAVSRANCDYLSERVSYKLGLAHALPIADASVDVVTSFSSRHHAAGTAALLSEVQRVLRPGGVLVIAARCQAADRGDAVSYQPPPPLDADHNEFLQSLSAAFPHVRMFAQRPLSGSIIAIADKDGSDGPPDAFVVGNKGLFYRTRGIPYPSYFVALASTAKLPQIHSSVLQNPSLLQHLQSQRQRAVDDATDALAQLEILQHALASSTIRDASLADELRRQANIHAVAAARIQTIRRELTAARGRNLELSGETKGLRLQLDERADAGDAVRRERDQRANEAEKLHRELARRTAEADHMRQALDQRTAETQALSHDADQRAITIDGLRKDREELVAEADGLRRDRDRYQQDLASIRDSTLWRATLPFRRVGSALPLRARRAFRQVTDDQVLHPPAAPPNPAAAAAPSAPLTDCKAADVTDPLPPPATFEIAPPAGEDATAEVPAPEAEAPAEIPNLGLLDPPAQPIADQGNRNSPSLLRQQLDPSWLEPSQRPEFIRLSNVRPNAKLAVVMHVDQPGVWPDLSQALCSIAQDFDLFITIVGDVVESLTGSIQSCFPDANVLLVEDHGRDVFPFLVLIRTGVLFNYDLICKVRFRHEKSAQGTGTQQRTIMDSPLGSAQTVTRILEAFQHDPDLGIVVPPGTIIDGRADRIATEARLNQLFTGPAANQSVFEQNWAQASVYWIRPLILRPIDALRLSFDDFEADPINDGDCTARVVEQLLSITCHDAGMRLADSTNLLRPPRRPDAPKVHVIANYLPQFHPIPENDAWWGKGFTEWTNVTKALPLFRGHHQPRLPTELGFYDLRLAQIRKAQADLAKSHGVTAFSYYYYWFNGRKLLNGPIEDVVASGEPDFPFMLCWANEPWTRNWDGLSQQILMPQDYAGDWERLFAADVAKIMRDRRYLRLNGAPMLALYRVAHFPDKVGSIGRLRAAFADEGFPAIHLIGAWVQIGDDEALPPQPSELGLDAYFEFPPHGIPSQQLEIAVADRAVDFAANTYDYGATVDAAIDQLAIGQEEFRYRGVMMGWDNTARRGNRSFAFHGATPANFRRWLRAALRSAQAEAREKETALFINAWNEWAEGTYLEPDRVFGRGWLEAVASATADTGANLSGTDTRPAEAIEPALDASTVTPGPPHALC